MRTLFLAVLLTACSGSGVGQDTTCDDLCDTLVNDCAYAAFPNLGSCLDGCAFYQEEGADVGGQLACVDEAACDTFAIVECEHEFGLETSDPDSVE